MSVGNLDPTASSFTNNGMILGSENIPSTLYNALVNNTGFNLYSPVRTHAYRDLGGTFATSSGTTALRLGYHYFAGGNYDIESRIGAMSMSSIGIGTIWLQIGTILTTAQHVFNNSGTTVIESKVNVALPSGWHQVLMIFYQGISSNEFYLDYVDSFIRQRS